MRALSSSQVGGQSGGLATLVFAFPFERFTLICVCCLRYVGELMIFISSLLHQKATQEQATVIPAQRRIPSTNTVYYTLDDMAEPKSKEKTGSRIARFFRGSKEKGDKEKDSNSISNPDYEEEPEEGETTPSTPNGKKDRRGEKKREKEKPAEKPKKRRLTKGIVSIISNGLFYATL